MSGQKNLHDVETITAPATGTHARETNVPLSRRICAGAVSAALVAALCPLSAIARSGSTSSTTGATTSQAADSSTGPGNGGTPPSKPEGDGGQGGGSGEMGEPPSGEAPDGMGGGGGADTQSFDYDGSYTGALTADGESVESDGESYSATESDQNAALVENGGTLTLTNGTLDKSGDDSDGDRCNFYGVNSILLSVGENSQANVSATTLSATSEGSNGIFATDSGTVFANDDTITTTADNSRGLDATYGGTIIANEMDITTEGDHCAAIATDRGGGNISVTNSTLSTAGSGSPLLYSTGDIEVSGVTGTSTGSQIAGMEGLNTILINASTLESTQSEKTASDPVADGIIIYQSTSGDAETSTGEAASFQAADSTLKSAISSGSMFYLTNTTANVVLKNTVLDFDSSAANLLLVAGNDSNNWGSAGSNGATVTFTGIEEIMEGTIEVDTISQADVYLTESTNWTGAATITENEAGSTSDSPLNIYIDDSSAWVVIDDSTVSNLTVADGAQIVDPSGNTVSIVAGGETVVEGDSSVTITVEGSYSTSYDASGAGTLAEETIDRSAFDEEYGTDTAFSMGDGAQTASADSSDTETTDTESSDDGGSFNLWDAIVSFFKGLFGLD